MKVGVFGGTFDPIHDGHLKVAGNVRVELGLEEVLFVTAGEPWMKFNKPAAEARHRLAMVELAIAEEKHFRSLDIEVQTKGPSYTSTTLRSLHGQIGDKVELYLIVGMDALNGIKSWHRPAELFLLSTVVAVRRPGLMELDAKAIEEVSKGAADTVIEINGPMIGISSTLIKERIRLGLPISQHVPESVESYIVDNHLYRSTDN